MNLREQQEGQEQSYIVPASFQSTSSDDEKATIKYVAGAYCRLSREDENRTKASDSIEVQKLALSHYAKKYNIELYDFYIDDGCTGTNFQRPGWQRMLKDIEDGKLNMVIAKDFSRIGRDNEGVGAFRKEMKKKEVRVVTLHENHDSLIMGHDVAIEVINLFNAMYSQDISAKTRLAKSTKAEAGKFVGSYAPYGYQKDPNDKNHLIPSEDADIVREIFQMVSEGKSVREIADDLSRRKIVTPSCRINYMYGGYQRRVPPRDTWNTSTITQMLDNMVYIGHMVQGKRCNLDHTGMERRLVKPTEQHFVENTHEAIVSISLWNKVQKLREKNRKQKCKVHKMKETGVNLFSGLLRCADCGRILAPTKKTLKDGYYTIFRCSGYNNGGRRTCSSHTIRYDALYEIVLSELRRDATLAETEYKELCGRLYKELSVLEHKENKRAVDELKAAEGQRKCTMARIQKTMEQQWDGVLDEEITTELLKGYQEEKKHLDSTIENLKRKVESEKQTNGNIKQWTSKIKKCLELESLDRHVLFELIDNIVVHECEVINGEKYRKIEIYYKFIGNALQHTAAVRQ